MELCRLTHLNLIGLTLCVQVCIIIFIIMTPRAIHTSLHTEPDDYTSVTVDMTFNALNSDQMLCVDIPINDDLLCEGLESLFITISSTDSDIVINEPTLPVNIIDNDGKISTLFPKEIFFTIFPSSL